MSWVTGLVIAGGVAYYMYSQASKGTLTAAESDYAAKESLRNAPDTGDLTIAAQQWSQNPRVMYSPFYISPPKIDPTRDPPISTLQSIANSASDPSIYQRPGGIGSSSDNTGTRQEAATTKSIEELQSPINLNQNRVEQYFTDGVSGTCTTCTEDLKMQGYC